MILIVHTCTKPRDKRRNEDAGHLGAWVLFPDFTQEALKEVKDPGLGTDIAAWPGVGSYVRKGEFQDSGCMQETVKLTHCAGWASTHR